MKIKVTEHPSPHGTITLVKLTNATGASVVLSSLGAGIVEVNVPDADGILADVAMGYMDVRDYYDDGPCMGKTPGRYANRIAKGCFAIDGKEYRLNINNGPNHLHGGPQGFHNKIWDWMIVGNSVIFGYHSPDGDEHYPGDLDAQVTYTWDDEADTLSVFYHATTTAPTPVNLTNHSYFNLDGEGSPEGALGHMLQIYASRFVETDKDLTPTGTLLDVEGTPMDFREPKVIGKDILADYTPLKYGKGYDHCYALDAYEPAKGEDDEAISVFPAAVLSSPKSGRRLTVSTSLPGVQLYTANWLTGSTPRGRHGAEYKDYDGVALECQMFPDSPNHPNFPQATLRPGEEYNAVIIFEFDIAEELD